MFTPVDLTTTQYCHHTVSVTALLLHVKVAAATSGLPKCIAALSSPPSEVKVVTTPSPHPRRSGRITFQEIILDSYADAVPVAIKQGRRGRGRAFFTVTSDSSASTKSVSAAV